MLKSIKYQIPALVWTVIILLLCCLPMKSVSEEVHFFEGFDKVVHLGLFFVLTVFLFNGRSMKLKTYKYHVSTVIKIILSTFLFGGFIELLQLEFFTYRSAEWWDIFADMTGVCMAIFSYILLHKKRDFTFN
jgi:VanZ family protein